MNVKHSSATSALVIVACLMSACVDLEPVRHTSMTVAFQDGSPAMPLSSTHSAEGNTVLKAINDAIDRSSTNSSRCVLSVWPSEAMVFDTASPGAAYWTDLSNGNSTRLSGKWKWATFVGPHCIYLRSADAAGIAIMGNAAETHQWSIDPSFSFVRQLDSSVIIGVDSHGNLCRGTLSDQQQVAMTNTGIGGVTAICSLSPSNRAIIERDDGWLYLWNADNSKSDRMCKGKLLWPYGYNNRVLIINESLAVDVYQMYPSLKLIDVGTVRRETLEHYEMRRIIESDGYRGLVWPPLSVANLAEHIQDTASNRQATPSAPMNGYYLANLKDAP